MSGIAEMLAQVLPIKTIYEDAAQPAVRQIGMAAEDVVKCLRLALAPVQFLGVQQDRYRDFLVNSVKKVPEEKRITPPPQILGPIIEALRYEPEGTPLDEIASNLLATSMNADTVEKAHPAYTGLIKQLSRDEIVIIKELYHRSHTHVLTADYVEFQGEFGPYMGFQNHQRLDDTFPWHDLHFPNNKDFYINHLHSLGLGGIFSVDGKALRNDNGLQIGTYEKKRLDLSDFGRAFAEACRL
ncbi:DUF4393 domain-containing protein [Asticcacaulis sp. AND118]|uniref:DUF4393 domain-containing protein n=1 Tax=Asticcacaulis sp. AND118 TaxID=2840468 RepID=UPI001CFFCFB0|nr:DUF4393 domain-containing protein [Asticcacaulis sp. AND118]UDF04602.1 DUF4393 domain-containing protein [Asticcacaulis sp. AND118]